MRHHLTHHRHHQKRKKKKKANKKTEKQTKNTLENCSNSFCWMGIILNEGYIFVKSILYVIPPSIYWNHIYSLGRPWFSEFLRYPSRNVQTFIENQCIGKHRATTYTQIINNLHTWCVTFIFFPFWMCISLNSTKIQFIIFSLLLWSNFLKIFFLLIFLHLPSSMEMQLVSNIRFNRCYNSIFFLAPTTLKFIFFTK